jgi:hypothetical protein
MEEEAKNKSELIKEILEKYNPQEVFEEEDHQILITHYRNEHFNQFYLYIINKVLEIKNFTVNTDNIKESLTVILADKVGKTSAPAETDIQIVNFANTVYKILMIIDITEFYNQNNF